MCEALLVLLYRQNVRSSFGCCCCWWRWWWYVCDCVYEYVFCLLTWNAASTDTAVYLICIRYGTRLRVFFGFGWVFDPAMCAVRVRYRTVIVALLSIGIVSF